MFAKFSILTVDLAVVFTQLIWFCLVKIIVALCFFCRFKVVYSQSYPGSAHESKNVFVIYQAQNCSNLTEHKCVNGTVSVNINTIAS